MANVVTIRVAGECSDKACRMPLARLTYDDGRSVTVHDDGSWDGHEAWQGSTTDVDVRVP